MQILYKVLIVLSVIIALLFSLLIFATGKGDAMSGGSGVRTSFKGKASFEDIMSKVTLWTGIVFMFMMLALDMIGSYLAKHQTG